ncbi:MAG: histidinol-phosphate transaminase [Opitutales bacterium]
MNLRDLVKPSVLSQPVYQPGKPIERVAVEFGLDPSQVLKLASNENPLGPSPKAAQALRDAAAELHLYPDGGCTELREAIARHHGLDPAQIVVGNGSNEVFELLGHAFIRPGDACVMSQHAFIVYKLVTLLFEGRVVEIPMRDWTHDLQAMRAAITPETRAVFVASPNNPIGTANAAADILGFAESLPEQVIFCFDEAYAEYLDTPPDLRPLIAAGRKILCTRTFSKVHGLAGLRLGYGYASAELIGYLQQVREPFNVNRPGQAAALAALHDAAWVTRARVENAAGRAQLTMGLRAQGLEVIEGQANFVVVTVPDAGGVFERLQRAGVIVRPLAPYGLPDCLRISVGTADQNTQLLRTLERVLSGSAVEAPMPS